MFTKRRIIIMSIGLVVGAVAGFAYYYYVGCRSGSCPIQSNPYVSTIYGALIGIVFTFKTNKKPKSE